jgi:hypothetical protein
MSEQCVPLEPAPLIMSCNPPLQGSSSSYSLAPAPFVSPATSAVPAQPPYLALNTLSQDASMLCSNLQISLSLSKGG